MEMLEIKIEMPEEVVKAIPDLSSYTYDKLILGLYQDEEISLGKAAQLLHKSTDEFIQYFGKHQIPYFRSKPGEIQKELSHLGGEIK